MKKPVHSSCLHSSVLIIYNALQHLSNIARITMTLCVMKMEYNWITENNEIIKLESYLPHTPAQNKCCPKHPII